MNHDNRSGKMNAQKRRTNKIICDSFIELLSHTSLEKMSVRELCESADINRATFYRYYTDLYDLYGHVTDNFFEELFTETVDYHRSNGLNSNLVEKEILQGLTIIEKNKTLCKILLNTTTSVFSERLAMQIASTSISMNIPDQAAGDLLRTKIDFMNGGILSVVVNWLKNDCQMDKSVIVSVICPQVLNTFC